MRNWAELWTQTHLEQRLLKPLGGIRLTISESGLAILDFESAKTAQRAELICRAAAKAATENLRNRPKSRSRTPPIVQEAKSMTPGPISLGKVSIDIGSGHPPRDPDSTGSQVRSSNTTVKKFLRSVLYLHEYTYLHVDYIHVSCTKRSLWEQKIPII